MKAKKLFALLLCAIMVLSLVGCKKADETKETDSPTGVTDKDTKQDEKKDEVKKEEEKKDPEPLVEVKEASIDFEDGLYGFVALYTAPANADPSEFSIADFNGSKALRVTNMAGKVPYLAIDISSLAGDKIADVKSITMDIGTEHPDGTFYATSGKIIAYSGEKRTESNDPWSVYLATKNPNAARAILDEGEEFIAGYQNMIILTLDTDNGATEGAGNASFYIDNIRLLDGSDNVIKADSTVAFAEPPGFSDVDRVNLIAVKNEVEVWSGDSGAAWGQGTGVNTLAQGGTLDPALITEDSVITIYFQSEGDMWLVLQSWEDGAPFGWQRVADQGASIKNPSNTIAQITYNQLVKYCNTDDFVTYLSMLQCESDMEWSVSSVTIGQRSGIVELKNEVDIWTDDSGDAWAQGTGIQTLSDGGPFDPALIQPGCIINIEYKSDGNMWLVAVSGVEGSPFSWQRIADQGNSLTDGSTCQITYDQLVQYLGTDDFVTYLSKLQCESDMPWEVYRVSIGYPAGLVPVANEVEIPEFAGDKGDAWSQGTGVQSLSDGGTFDPALIQPGCIYTIDYASDGMMWVVMQSFKDGAPYSWQRVADQGVAADNGKRAQITYDQLVEYCKTDDFVTTLSQLQCESDMPWEVYKFTIGYPVD
ncbi:MAG: hypothetical protein EWM47_06625 [Anaerolineaceae bacterium]|nr:MAG: hypothetical protein EWM47_06625 [Anaerolineaceae bacterium]